MLVLTNVRMEPSNVRKNNKTIECDKNTVTSDVGTTQCNNGTAKCKEKIKVPLNVRKIRSNMMLVLPNVTIEPSNVRKK